MRSPWEWVHRLSEWHHHLSSGLINSLRTRRMDADRDAVAGIVFIRASLPIRRNSKRPKSKEARAIGLPGSYAFVVFAALRRDATNPSRPRPSNATVAGSGTLTVMIESASVAPVAAIRRRSNTVLLGENGSKL